MTKFVQVPYNKPEKKDMAVILVYFNPTKAMRPIQNLLLVKHMLETAGIPLYITELAFNEEPFLFTASDTIQQYRSTSYMFYKENLIKATEAKIPPTYTKLCMLDADILFDHPDWYSIVSEKLDSCDVCQPFTKTHFLTINYIIGNSIANCVDRSDKYIEWGKEHTGHAWAFDRAWWTAANITDLTVVGGGDFMLISSIRRLDTTGDGTIRLYNCIFEEKEAVRSSCDLNIYHLYHGTIVNRQYEDRIGMFGAAMAALSLEKIPQTLIRRDDGILEWRPEYRDTLNACMFRYFSARDDDSI